MLRVICCDIIEACVLVIKTHASFYENTEKIYHSLWGMKQKVLFR